MRDVPSAILLFFVPGGYEEYLVEMGEPVIEGQPPPSGPIHFERAARIGPLVRTLEIVRREPDL